MRFFKNCQQWPQIAGTAYAERQRSAVVHMSEAGRHLISPDDGVTDFCQAPLLLRLRIEAVVLGYVSSELASALPNSACSRLAGLSIFHMNLSTFSVALPSRRANTT